MKMKDVLLGAGKEIIQAQNVMPFFNQAVAKMGSQKSGAAGHQDTFLIMQHDSILR
jgi:hypothetical protein